MPSEEFSDSVEAIGEHWVDAFYCFADEEAVPRLINMMEFSQEEINDLCELIDCYAPPDNRLTVVRVLFDPNNLRNHTLVPQLRRVHDLTTIPVKGEQNAKLVQ
jgi:hypothetical protein